MPPRTLDKNDFHKISSFLRDAQSMFTLPHLSFIVSLKKKRKKIRKIYVYKNENCFPPIGHNQSLPVHLIARAGHVSFLIPALCLLGNRLWRNGKPLLAGLHLIQRQENYHDAYPSDAENV